MKTVLGIGLLSLSWCVFVACSSDAATGASGGAAGAGDETPAAGAGPTSSNDACHDGCVSTIAAHCSNGPLDQAGCENQCHALQAGNCGTEYAALQTCGQGKTITCSAEGLPSVTGCTDQQAAFVACLNK